MYPPFTFFACFVSVCYHYAITMSILYYIFTCIVSERVIYCFYGGDKMNERIKLLRESLGLSQKAFSEKILVGSSTLAMWELGTRTIKDIHISKICSEFNVDENWLRTGNGEMFVQLDRDEAIVEWAASITNPVKDGEDEEVNLFIKKFAHTLTRLNVDEWKVLHKIMNDVINEKED